MLQNPNLTGDTNSVFSGLVRARLGLLTALRTGASIASDLFGRIRKRGLTFYLSGRGGGGNREH